MSVLANPVLAKPVTNHRIAVAKPLYAQVRDLLLERVRAGEWAAGESLPNEFVLSSDFNVSIGTVRRAVAELEASGVLVRKQGRGTYLAGAGSMALQHKFCGVRSPAGERVMPAYQLVSLLRRPAAACETGPLERGDATPVFEVLQLLMLGGTAVGLETSVVPAALFPRLETQVRFGQHLYPVLADYGFLITRVEETIGLEIAGGEEAARLETLPGSPLLAVERVSIAMDGSRVELRRARYIASRVRYAGGSTPG